MVFYDFENKNILNLASEETLQLACVKYLRKCEDSLFSCNGIPDTLDTDDKRINAYNLGYLKGCPDLIIYLSNDKYNLLCIEFKNCYGSGVLSKEQNIVLERLEKDCKAFCCVINSLEAFVEIYIKYVNNLL